MSAELKGRPVLRPAGNVALMRHESRGNRGVTAKKQAKKPPFSPPLKPSLPAAVKISPPNSQPSTPRNALSKSPLLKPSAPPKQPPPHSPRKPSRSSVFTKTCPAPPHRRRQSLDPLSVHLDAFSTENTAPCPNAAHLDDMSVASRDTTDVCVASDRTEGVGAVVKPPECQLHLASGSELLPDHTPSSFSNELFNDLEYMDDGLVSEELDMHAQSHGVALSPPHIAEPQTTPVELLKVQGKRNGTSTGSSNRDTSSTRSPVVAAAQGRPKSYLTRSSSDNCRRGPAPRACGGKASSIGGGKNMNCLASSHSLDDVSLAGLVAAKKAADLEARAQRKLKVAEYGRKPGKASRVAPEVPSVSPVVAELSRCKFITAQSDPLHVAYHDQEWGTPLHDDRGLFELLVLAGVQVELSWTTILQRREAYRDAFCGYDPESVASFSERHIQSLQADEALSLPGGKIRGVVENAQRILEVVKEFGSLDHFLWSFVSNMPMVNNYRYAKQVPTKTSKSEFISKDLVKRGFRCVGPTIIYSFMQAAGMTNDHLVQCFRHQACTQLRKSSREEAELEPCAGMTNDHLVQCFRHQACTQLRKSSREEAELEPCAVAESGDAPSMHGDAGGASAVQLFCKHDTLADPQGPQSVMPRTVHV